MDVQIFYMLAFLVGIFLLLYLNDQLHKRFGIASEYTRKLAHFSATGSTLAFPLLFTSHWYPFVLALVFFLILLLSMNTKYLKSIHEIDRYSAGSFLLPPAIYLPFLISVKVGDPFFFILPTLILAVSDPLAGLAGYIFRKGNPKIVLFSRQLNKTIYGSLTFFVSSFVLSLAAMSINTHHLGGETLMAALFMAAATTVTEMLSPGGTDNITVPMMVILVLSLYNL
jgi:dolichol kinase